MINFKRPDLNKIARLDRWLTIHPIKKILDDWKTYYYRVRDEDMLFFNTLTKLYQDTFLISYRSGMLMEMFALAANATTLFANVNWLQNLLSDKVVIEIFRIELGLPMRQSYFTLLILAALILAIKDQPKLLHLIIQHVPEEKLQWAFEEILQHTNLLENSSNIHRFISRIPLLIAYCNYKYAEKTIKEMILNSLRTSDHDLEMIFENVSPLHCAIAVNDSVLAKNIIQEYIDKKLDLVNPLCGVSALCVAIINRQDEIAQELIKKGTLIENDMEEYYPLALAVDKGLYYTVKSLCEKGAKLDILFPKGDSLLHRCVTANYVEIAAYLLSLGVNINSQNDQQNTPLHLALENPDEDMLICLLAHHPNLDIPNKMQETPHFILENYRKRRNETILSALQKVESYQRLTIAATQALYAKLPKQMITRTLVFSFPYKLESSTQSNVEKEIARLQEKEKSRILPG